MDHRLWGMSRSVGALAFIGIFASVIFVPCFLLVDRYPRRGLIRVMLALALASIALAGALLVYTVMAGIWTRDTLGLAALGAFVLVAAALAFVRAAAHGEEVKWLHPSDDDPVGHWIHTLRSAPMWWLRSRAARELQSSTEDERAVSALRESLTGESNRHVRRAVSAGLARASA